MLKLILSELIYLNFLYMHYIGIKLACSANVFIEGRFILFKSIFFLKSVFFSTQQMSYPSPSCTPPIVQCEIHFFTTPVLIIVTL